MKVISISGVTGFIGLNLSKFLLNKGYKIIGIDNFHSSSKKNLEILDKYKSFMFYKWDIRRYPKFLEKYDIDIIINLACPASPKWYMKDPVFTLETSFIGTKNLLDLAKKKNSIFLQASTSEVYGDPEIHPQNEEYRGNVNTLGPRACYDEGKRVAETLCYEYWRNYGTDVRIMRIFNTYGPYMDIEDGRVISNFITQALKGEDITIYGDGKQTRSFQYIDDLVSAIYKYITISREELTEKLKTKFNWNTVPTLNLGNPEEYKILDLAKIILKLTNSESKIVFKEKFQDDPKQRRPDITKAKYILNWEPKIKLIEGLQKTISYFKEVLF